MSDTCSPGAAEARGVRKRLPPSRSVSRFFTRRELADADKSSFERGLAPVKQTQILDKTAMERSITRMAHEVLERNKGLHGVVLVGIKTRGAHLADRIADKLQSIEGERPPVWHLDVRAYRDDVKEEAAVERPAVAGLNVENQTVVLVDDVLYTGRTVRAALDAVMASGRPTYVQLASLVDRGHRELPIRPDYVGKNVPTARDEVVSVRLSEVDEEDGVWIVKPN